MSRMLKEAGAVGALVLGLAVAAIGLAVGNVSAEGDVATSEGHDMAVAVIEAAIASLREHPNQLSITINSTGFQASNTGGIGFNSSPIITGGSGSYTGFKAEGIGNVQVLQGTANEVAAKQSAETVAVLEQIRDALQKRQADKAQSLLGTLKEKAVNVIYEVVKAAALSKLGLLK